MTVAGVGTRVARRLARAWRIGALLTLAFLIAGCGAAGRTSSGSGGGSSSGGVSAPGTNGMTVRPCLGDYAGGFSPAVTLTRTSPDTSTSVHVGDTIEVRFNATGVAQKWSFSSVDPSTALKTLGAPGGAFDRSTGSCVWDFQALQPGVVTIGFTGVALCEPQQPCPAYAILQKFTIHVS